MGRVHHVNGSSRPIRARTRYCGAAAAAIVSIVLLTTDAAMQAPTAKPQPAQAPPAPSPYADLVRAYLWPESNADRQQAEARLGQDPSLAGLSRVGFHTLEEDIRRGPMRL